MKGILLGILASVFFAFTFIFNRSMELSGGSWIWSSSLRFLFMVPFFFIIVLWRGNFKGLYQEIKTNPLQWLLWSFVGFVLFYTPITFAAAYGPGWLIAGTWQFTIIAGILIVPLFFREGNGTRAKIPMKALKISLLIFLGIILIQLHHVQSVSLTMVLLGFLPVILATFAYPLGNRKMMEVCGGRLDVFQRILGMLLASLPFWLILSGIGVATVGLPSQDQVIQTFIVGLCSGVIATTLFFFATDLVRNAPEKLAAVEATQSTQVIFVIIGEMLLLSAPLPNWLAWGGILIIMIGMILHSLSSSKSVKVDQKKQLKSS
ncbi:multidrug resistance efflux transporter family protein [Alkalihalobacillus sp. LMS39]|uniref:DMT family transporter n=1 Tax=Alkalihalobacillus sp. LMS39 TaxID=2924032 RepID=UPI001FB351B1|nr:multidrug resistance efflux transporter family protein [Alkalihalobacillus sp. LMS39]UOE92220.1 multidrug resistance efflux transporter family protein [Alkalihalobacillus sp. LMS39]